MTSGPELQCNNATTTLATGYTAGTATISVASTTSYGSGYGQFPTLTGAAFFRVKCGSVIFKVTAVNTSTNVWNVTVVETADASQGANTAIASVLTAAAVNDLTQSGSITDSDIAASAAIEKSKLGPLSIVDADVSATAAIEQSKLALDADPGAHAARHEAGGADALPWGTILGAGTDASKPAAATSNAGYLWIATDTGKVYQSSGTAWTAVHTPPTVPGAATTAAPGTVEIDVAPASGNPVALTAAGLTPSSVTGAPTTGTWIAGELAVDSAHALYVCTAGGTPGTWAQVGGGNSGMTNPMQNPGDLIVGGAAGAPARQAIGSLGQVLEVVNGAPYLAAPAAPGLTQGTTGDLALGAYGVETTYVNAQGETVASAATSLTTSNVLAAPAAPTVADDTTAGTVAAGTYGVEVTYVNAAGETIASAATSHATSFTGATTGEMTISSPAASGNATGWYAYVTQAGGTAYTRQQAAGSPTAIGTNLVISAPPTSTGAAPPASNTASTSSLTIASPAAEGAGNQAATGWYAYVTQAGGTAYTRQQTAGSPTAIGTALTLTAPPTSTGAAPPASNTAGTLVPGYGTVAGGGAMTNIASTTLTASAASITFSSIPGTYGALLLECTLRGDTAAVRVACNLTCNGDTGSNYDAIITYGGGAMSTTGAGSTPTTIGLLQQTAINCGSATAAQATAGEAGRFRITIPRYAGTTFNKQTLGENVAFADLTGAGNNYLQDISGNWRNTAAITSLTVTPASGNWIAGSSCTLYGLS